MRMMQVNVAALALLAAACGSADDAPVPKASVEEAAQLNAAAEMLDPPNSAAAR